MYISVEDKNFKRSTSADKGMINLEYHNFA